MWGSVLPLVLILAPPLGVLTAVIRRLERG